MISTRPARQPRTRRWTLPLVLALFTAAACAADADLSATTDATAIPTPTPSTRPSTGATPISVTVGAQTFTAELYDNPTAHDLAVQLPLTVTMDDLNGLEKTGRLPRALNTDGVPRGSDPEPNEIGYYAPGHDLVLYDGDVGYYTGIIRIGRFGTAIEAIADQPDGVTVTVERS